MSAFTGLINNSTISGLFTDAIDELIAACEVPCTLIYGYTKFTDCPNCTFDAIGNKSSNRYQNGGPAPFSFGMCPMCHGVGRIADEQTVTMNLVPLWDRKQWVGVADINIGNPNDMMQTLSVITTYDDLKEAKEIIVDTGISIYGQHRFERAGMPIPCGFGASSYIFTTWKRKA